MEQLDFEILLNPSVPPEDELRLSRQAHAIYNLFMDYHKLGLPVPNTELTKIAFQYQARLYEIRRALIPLGWCIDLVQKSEDGVNCYDLVRLEQSQFYSEHKDRL